MVGRELADLHVVSAPKIESFFYLIPDLPDHYSNGSNFIRYGG